MDVAILISFYRGRYQIGSVSGHDDVFKWKHIPRYWPFVRGIHRSPVNSQHKGQWRGALMFSMICVWINCWVNNREAGDLRRYRAHSDVTVMSIPEQCRNSLQKRDVVNDPRHQSPHTVKPYIDLIHGVKPSRKQICENVWALSTKIYNALQERLSKYNGWCHWTCQTANAIQLVIICFMVLSLGLKHRHAVNNCVITVMSHERHGLTSPATWLFCSMPVLTSQVESNGVLH